ncbi:MAG: type II secretion system F family protein [Sphingomonadaceae bacterium]|nr:type II secretion system F family protein [Sphingomonadaceae bacterium]
MAAFAYRALDAGGAARRGVVEASSAVAARALLRDRGLVPLAVTEGRAARVRLGAKALAALTRQLATLIGSEVRVEEALRLVAAHADARQAALLLGVRGAVLDGQSLAAALAARPDAFPDYFRASVAAGEASGRLADVLAHLADFVEGRAQAASRLGVALIYPALLAGVSLAMTAALLEWVVPDIARVFVARGAALPLLTRLLIGASATVARSGTALLVVAAAGGWALRRWLADPGHRLALDRALAAGPAGGFVRRLAAARFAGTLATLVASDVQLVDAVAIAAAVTPNRFVRARAAGVAARVRDGASLRTAMEAAGIFPPMLVAVVASGEASGRLGVVLGRAAADLQHEVDAATAAATALVEPAVLLAMGGIVLLLVLAILLPIIGLNDLAGA